MTIYRTTFYHPTFYCHRLLGLCLALLFALLSNKNALAHADLVRAEPADGATLSAPPSEFHLWFNESIAQRFSNVQILNAQGQPVPGVDLSAKPAEPTALLVRLPQLPVGAYTLIWKTLSEADGHFSQGMLLFGVNVAAPGAPSIKFTTVNVPLVEVVLRWLNFVSLAGIVGAVAILLFLWRPWLIHSQQQHARNWLEAQQRIFHVAGWSVVLALLTGVVLLVRQVWVLQEVALPVAGWRLVNWSLITQTRWGELWLVRQGLLLLLLALFLLWRNPVSFLRTKWWLGGLMLAICLALLIGQALTGHAAGNPRNVWLALAMTTLHLVAASLWVGGLGALTIGWLPLMARQPENRLDLLRMGFQPFGRLAALSVGVLIATGLYNSGQQVPSLDAFILTAYGWLLLGKIGLVLVVSSLGLLNALLLHRPLATAVAHWLGRPAAWRPVGIQRLPLLILAEVVLGALVLLVTGVLTASAPPRGVAFTVAPESEPTAVTQTIDDLRVTLEVKPNRPGQNVFSVQTVSQVDPPPAEIMRVLLRFTYLDSDFGRVSAKTERIGPGRYLLNGNDLKLAGSWQIDVVTRRHGIEDSVAHFNWVVMPSAPLPPTVLSKRSLATPLTLASLGLLFLVALGGFVLSGYRHLPYRLQKIMVASKAHFAPNQPRSQVYELPSAEINTLSSD